MNHEFISPLGLQIAGYKVPRAKNLTQNEKDTLIALIKRHENIIENKSRESNDLEEKQKTWESIAQQFNATTKTEHRTGGQLRTWYKTYKSLAKNSTSEIDTNSTTNENQDRNEPIYIKCEQSNDNNIEDQELNFVQNDPLDMRQPPSALSNRQKVLKRRIRTNFQTLSAPSDTLKRMYYKKKYELVCFKLKAAKEIHRLDVEVKRKQLEKLDRISI